MDNSSWRTTTNNTTSDIIGPGASLAILNSGILVFCFAVGIFLLLSNGCTLFFLYNLKDELKRDFSLIAGLSFSDIIFGVGTICYASSRIYEIFYESNMYICASVLSVLEIGATSSLFHTFYICFERLLAVSSRTAVKRQLGFKGRASLIGISTTVIGFYYCCWKIITPFDNTSCTLPHVYEEYYDIYLGVTVFAICSPFLLCTVVFYLVTLWIIKSRAKGIQKVMTSVNSKLKNPEIVKEVNEHHNAICSSAVQIHVPTSRVDCNVESAPKQNSHTTNINITNVYPRDEKSQSDGIELNKSNRIETADISNKHIQIIDVDTKIKKPSEIVVDKRQFSTSTRKNHKMKAMKTIGLVVLVLVLFTGSAAVLFTIDFFCRSCVSVRARTIVGFLWAFNSALNPCIYYFTIDEFRYSVKRKFTFCNR